MRKEIEKYKGFSLVEVLLTIMILSIVMLLVASTLNTVIKASNTANAKNLARNDINYIMDVYSRLLSNAELSDIYLYNSSSVREFALVNGLPVINSKPSLGTTYEDENLVDQEKGNEIHVRLYNYEYWTCLGYFESTSGICKDSNNKCGYIVKTTKQNLSNHADCFNSTSVITVLQSFSLNVSDFGIQYIDIGDEKNSMFIVNAQLTPLYWPISDSFRITRDVSRQIVISTEALTWY